MGSILPLRDGIGDGSALTRCFRHRCQRDYSLELGSTAIGRLYTTTPCRAGSSIGWVGGMTAEDDGEEGHEVTCPYVYYPQGAVRSVRTTRTI